MKGEMLLAQLRAAAEVAVGLLVTESAVGGRRSRLVLSIASTTLTSAGNH